jgi:hypothetical protein
LQLAFEDRGAQRLGGAVLRRWASGGSRRRGHG